MLYRKLDNMKLGYWSQFPFTGGTLVSGYKLKVKLKLNAEL